MGPYTTQLRQLFDDAVRGRMPRYAHWNIPVYASEAVRDHKTAVPG
jgi:hypothetical protein